MIISRQSRLVRWAYLDIWPLNRMELSQYAPRQTSVCALFWRASVISPVVIVCLTIAILVVAFPLFILWCGISGYHALAELSWWRRYASDEGPRVYQWTHLATDYMRAKKQRVCPIIYITK